MSLPRTAWVKLNRLRINIRRFHSSIHKWGLASSPNCECDTVEQTADHVLIAYPIHRAPYEARGLNDVFRMTKFDAGFEQHHCQHSIRVVQQPGVVKGQILGPSLVCVWPGMDALSNDVKFFSLVPNFNIKFA